MQPGVPYARAIPLKTENGQKVVVPFEELCETVNEGDKRLGLLKMDVDNLGLLFAAKEDESLQYPGQQPSAGSWKTSFMR